MSTEPAESGGEDRPAVGPCRNAEEYARKRLKRAEDTLTPSMLADDYGCTHGHMQDVLRESEDIIRVDHGEYALSAQVEARDGATRNRADSEGEATSKAGNGASGEDREKPRPQSGGPARSVDTDTTGQAGQESGTETLPAMPSQSELDRQRELAEHDRDGDQGESEVDDELEVVEESVGFDLPVSSTALFVGLAAFLAFAVWRAQKRRESQQSGQESGQNDQQSGQGQESDGGLI